MAEKQHRKQQQLAVEREKTIQASPDAAREAQKLEKERRLIEQQQISPGELLAAGRAQDVIASREVPALEALELAEEARCVEALQRELWRRRRRRPRQG